MYSCSFGVLLDTELLEENLVAHLRVLQNFFLHSRQKTQCLSIPLKASIGFHAVIKRSFAVVSKRRMPQVMRQSSKLDKIGINRGFLKGWLRVVDLGRDAFCNLSYLKRVRQSIPKKVRLVPGKKLGLSLEPPKRWRMQQAPVVASKT